MFGHMGQIMQLLKDAPRISQNLKDAQARLAEVRVVGEAGGGQVRATLDGKGDVVELRIEPELLKGGDVEMIEDLVCGALRDGLRQSREAAQQEMQSALGGMDLGGMMGMLGG